MRASKIAIILLGRPGSGKDTQAELLAKKFGLVHIISSKLIKRALAVTKNKIKIKNKIYDVGEQRRRQHNGQLVAFSFVASIVNDEITKLAEKKQGIITSGSPRTLTELKEELPLFKKYYGDKVFVFHVRISPREVYIRNLKRGRKDLPGLDTKKVIKKRLDVFNKYTWPVIKLLKKQKRIIDINGEQPIMKIHQDILKILENLWLSQSKQKKKLKS